jgi:general secretion pathway protein M
MMLDVSPQRQRFLALTILLAVVILVLFWIVLPLWDASSLHAERVGMLKRQAVAMEGLAGAAPKFEAEAKRLSANPAIQVLTFTDVQPALAVAQLQGQLSQMFASAPAAVTSSQVLPDTREGALTKVALQMTVEADMKALVKAMHAIAVARPLLKVEKLIMRDPDGDWAAIQTNAVPNKLQIEIVVSAYMRAP